LEQDDAAFGGELPARDAQILATLLKLLTGDMGSFASSARIARPLYRNFFTPERNDVIAGFRTCAL